MNCDKPPDDVVQGYTAALRSLLFRVRPRHLQHGVELLLARARRLATDEHRGLSDALERVYRRAAAQVCRRLQGISGRTRRLAQGAGPTSRRGGVRGSLEELLSRLHQAPGPRGPAADFWCDAALGGLARWLRAAGYDARWEYGIDDDALLRRVHEGWAILLTTDRRLFERGVVRAGVIPALWVSPAMNRHEQLDRCIAALQLPRRDPRCMRCGGRLVEVSKPSVAEQVPRRTLDWVERFYRCRRCNKVFWEGTHWQRIDERLSRFA
jgi:uncharacterized protein with PIN domain